METVVGDRTDDRADGTLRSLDLAFEIIDAFVARTDPDTVTGAQAGSVLEKFIRIERAAAAGRLGFARRAAECMRWREDGHPSAAAWLAQKAKTSVGEAISMLATARQLPALPATSEALRRGAVSPQQVREIAAAATEDPEAERDLLEAAEYLSLKGLQHRARSVRAIAARDDVQRRAAIHKGRFFRHWVDSEGAFNLHLRTTPDAQAPIMGAVRSRAAFVYDEQRRAGTTPERQEALDADALVALVLGDDRRATFEGVVETRRSSSATVFLHVNVEALRRGSLETGELCEIAGIGPVPLAAAESLLGASWVKLVVRDGVDVRTVCNLGRAIPAALEIALCARDRTCVVPGCDVYTGLETDHVVPFSEGGVTSLENLARLCRFHHRKKTYEGYRLESVPGGWQWLAPERTSRTRASPWT
ncbi:MAG: HNH endonuclease signature motif containing protein [Acidimicrobiales bacterium]